MNVSRRTPAAPLSFCAWPFHLYVDQIPNINSTVGSLKKVAVCQILNRRNSTTTGRQRRCRQVEEGHADAVHQGEFVHPMGLEPDPCLPRRRPKAKQKSAEPKASTWATLVSDGMLLLSPDFLHFEVHVRRHCPIALDHEWGTRTRLPQNVHPIHHKTGWFHQHGTRILHQAILHGFYEL